MGEYNSRLWIIGALGLISSASLGVSTATISDGNDMMNKWHSIGAKGFFILAFMNCFIISSIYSKLWKRKPGFCSYWSYLYKSAIGGFALWMLLVSWLMGKKVIEDSNLIEWAATFYVIGVFVTLGFDFKHINLVFRKK